MKRLLFTLLAAALLLTGCAQKPKTSYEVVTQEGSFTVDTVEQTISDGTHTYKYEVGRTKVEIIYPNGSSYWRSYGSGNSWHGGWSVDYDESAYVSGDILIDLLERDTGSSNKSGNPLLGILLIAVGLWNAIRPDMAWYISRGWYYKNAEPSDLALAMYRVGGVLAVLIGLGFTFL